MVMYYVAILMENTDYIFITLFRPGICVQSGTQQAYVLALDGGIETDNVKKYLHNVIVFEH